MTTLTVSNARVLLYQLLRRVAKNKLSALDAVAKVGQRIGVERRASFHQRIPYLHRAGCARAQTGGADSATMRYRPFREQREIAMPSQIENECLVARNECASACPHDGALSALRRSRSALC